MFSRTKEIDEFETLDEARRFCVFFGNEEAAEQAALLEQLHDRVQAIEAQIASQFTSLATYTQIAQEQVELARGESQAHARQVEQRLTSLIEREREDRLRAADGGMPGGSEHCVVARLNALEDGVAAVRREFREYLDRQNELAEAITRVFGCGKRSRGFPAPAPPTMPRSKGGETFAAPRVPPGTLPARVAQQHAESAVDSGESARPTSSRLPVDVDSVGTGSPMARMNS